MYHVFLLVKKSSPFPSKAEKLGVVVKNPGKYQIVGNVSIDLVQYSFDRIAGHNPASAGQLYKVIKNEPKDRNHRYVVGVEAA